ncbi:MAG: DUF4159 domain-containing protein [Candidatus Latescibacterota bacterium]|nr:DUF4159 domain-containing protein [Candidatus Latescibacterota bacterium]
MSNTLWTCLFLSLIMHLLGTYLFRDFWSEDIETEVFKARLANAPAMFKPRRLNAPKQIFPMPTRDLEYLPSDRRTVKVLDQDMALLSEPPKIDEPIVETELQAFASGTKAGEPVLDRVQMLSPSVLGLARSVGIPSMDLLRIADMARVNKHHSAVIVDLSNRRDLAGYINFTQLQLYGTGSGRGTLEALSRYLRDNTLILAKVRNKIYQHFLSENLVKDPIHFLIEGGGQERWNDNVLTRFSDQEILQLGEYLRKGGFLYVEGGNIYLREMRDQIKSALGDEAFLFPLPVSHSLYHSFYEFSGGFPGETKRGTEKEDGSPEFPHRSSNSKWYYPIQLSQEPIPQEQRTSFDPNTDNLDQLPKLGVWGIELNGRLVAVLCDIKFSDQWARSFDVETVNEDPTTPSLMVATNIVAYALTNPLGISVKLPPPVWAKKRPVTNVMSQINTWEEGINFDESDPEFSSMLDGSLAIIQAPLNSTIENNLELLIDGRYRLELLKRDYSGIVLHNIPSGVHWIEIVYGGERKQLDFDLQGGKVLTLNFALNRFFFLNQLRLEKLDQQVDISAWIKTFSDLRIDEIYLAEDREWLEMNEE